MLKERKKIVVIELTLHKGQRKYHNLHSCYSVMTVIGKMVTVMQQVCNFRIISPQSSGATVEHLLEMAILALLCSPTVYLALG